MSLDLLKNGKNYKQIKDILGEGTENSIRSKLYKIGEKSSIYFKKKEIVCIECKIIFFDPYNKKRKFCSNSCSAKFCNKQRKIINFCLKCENKIDKGRKYCSRECCVNHKNKILFDKIEKGNINLNERNYKKYLIYKYGDKCMECGWCKINPVTGNVPIQIEHIDGNSTNNNLENLKLLCPSCHSLTPTYGFLNKGKGRKKRYKK